MNCQLSVEGPKATVKLDGRFTFEHHAEFKSITRQAMETEGIQALDLDFSGVSYMDSSALGMLLLLREKAEAKGVTISLCKPTANVLAILKVVQFGKLFQIIT